MLDRDLNEECSLIDSWNNIADISQDLLVAFQEADWNRATKIASQRHECLVLHFKHFPADENNAVFYQKNLGDLLNVEPDLQALAVDARRETIRNGAKVQRGAKAILSYLS